MTEVIVVSPVHRIAIIQESIREKKLPTLETRMWWAFMAMILSGVWSYVTASGVKASGPSGYMLAVTLVWFPVALLQLPVLLHRYQGSGEVSWRKGLLWAALSTIISTAELAVYYQGLHAEKTGLVVAVIAAAPVITVLLAWFMNNEKLAAVQWLGVLLIVLGGFCISKNIN